MPCTVIKFKSVKFQCRPIIFVGCYPSTFTVETNVLAVQWVAKINTLAASLTEVSILTIVRVQTFCGNYFDRGLLSVFGHLNDISAAHVLRISFVLRHLGP